MFEKEAINKLRLECGRLTEDRMHLQNQLIAALSQQEKLEKDVRKTQYNSLYIELQPEKRVDTRTAKEFRDAALKQRYKELRENEDRKSHLKG